jgi:hypothetical protein
MKGFLKKRKTPEDENVGPLVLLVTTATVERCFSAMKIVKIYLLSDNILKHNVICYVEKEEMRRVTNDVVIDHFEILKTLESHSKM